MAARMVEDVREGKAIRDVSRLKWVGVVMPIGFIWGFELVRFLLLEGKVGASDAHVISALVMAVGVAFFGGAMALLLDRAQRQLVRQNRDLTALSGVGSAVHGDRPMPVLMRQVLDRLIAETGALAGCIRVTSGTGGPLTERRPEALDGGLAWTQSLLDERGVADAGPAYTDHDELDAVILDLPLRLEDVAVGHVRLLFHPARRPDLTGSVLVDLAREISTGIRLEQILSDLRHREREQSALHEVALQLTRRAETPEILDTITRHARELLAADRAVVRLAGEPGRPDGASGTCLIRPLRAPDALLGELCVVRTSGIVFSDDDGRLLAGLADLAAIAVRAGRLREAEEQWTILTERDRIARELHDSLAQVLGQIHLGLRALEMRADSSPIRPQLSELADTADEAYRDVRESILGLRETISSEGGLEGALREYLAKYTRQTGVQATLECSRAATRGLEPSAEVQLLRVVQEALTNVRKHARASTVAVRIATAGGAPVLSVQDDGVGFDPTTVERSMSGGFGLSAMRERVEQVGGTLEVVTAPGAGTRIVARLRMEGMNGAPASSAAVAAGR